MWLKKRNDLLAALLVLITFAAIFAITRLVGFDPAFKRIRARENCQTLGRSIRLVSKLKRGKTGEAEIRGTGTTLLYTWKGNSEVADNIARWPRISPKIRPWRYYKGIPKDLPSGVQNMKEFLKNFHPENRSEQDLLLSVRFIGFDPWGKPYLINIGNMGEKEAIEPGFVLLTWALSAGPNGVIETGDYLPSNSAGEGISQIGFAPSGDDIGYVIAAFPPLTVKQRIGPVFHLSWQITR